jgi:hypothetical protein
MKSLKLSSSPTGTTAIIIISIGVVYYILFQLFFLLAPCVQKNTPVFSFELLFTCFDYLEKITLAYLGLCSFILLMIRGTNIFNSMGLIISRVLVLIAFVTFIIMYVFNWL